MELTLVPHNWKEFIFRMRISFVELSIHLGSGIIPGGKENDKARQAVFFTLLHPFGNDPDEEKPHDDCTVPLKVHYHTQWKHNRDAVYWIKYSRPQDQGYRCVPEQRSEYSRDRTSENWFEQNLYSRRPS